jgi:hypothetical protein
MSSLPTWAAWVIVAACPLLGPVIAFLVVLPIAALDRWISRAKGAPAHPPPELVHTEPSVSAAPGLSPEIILIGMAAEI